MVDNNSISSETKNILDRLKNVINDSGSTIEINRVEKNDEVIDLTEKASSEPEVENNNYDNQIDLSNITQESESQILDDATNLDSLIENEENYHDNDFEDDFEDDFDYSMPNDELLNQEVKPPKSNNVMASLNDVVEAKKISDNITYLDKARNESYDLDEEKRKIYDKEIEDILADDDNVVSLNNSTKTDDAFLDEFEYNFDDDFEEDETEENYQTNEEDTDEEDNISELTNNWEDIVKSELDDVNTISMNNPELNNGNILSDSVIERAVETATNRLKSYNPDNQASMRLPNDKRKQEIDDEFDQKSYDLDKFIDSHSKDNINNNIDFNNYDLNTEEDLVSDTTKNATKELFSEFKENYTKQPSNSNTLEELVKEMLKPTLKEWLNENLTGIVERVVRDELNKMK